MARMSSVPEYQALIPPQTVPNPMSIACATFRLSVVSNEALYIRGYLSLRTGLTGMTKARNVIEKDPVKLMNRLKLGTTIEQKPVSSTVRDLYTMLLT